VSIPLTLLTLAAGALLTWSVASRRRRASRIGEALTAADAALHATLSDALASMKLVRSYGAEPRHGAALDRAIGALRATHVGQASGPITIRLWFDLGASVALAAAAWVGIRQLAMHPAELVVLLVLFLRLTPQLSYLQVYYHGLLTDLPAFLAVSRLEQACAAEADQDAGAAEAGPALAWERAVTLDAVTVRYGDVRALDAVSIEVPAGATIAIAGASGAGKTTLADVVLGLLPPETGCLRVDGRPLSRDTLRAWRDQVAYVPQDPFLFNTTIRENLLWAEPGASTADLEAALRQAAAGFVFELPAGLDSPVGDRGSLLAGGERQRIALARALLRAPRLLVLDEATSALDSENERSIRDALDRLHGRMAILVIAHRLATVQTADRIYVLDRGRLVEEGTWSQLVARDGGRFRALWRAQRLDAASVAAAGEAAALL
jgi:ATP-binding cassette subfamily C protein